MSRTNISIKNHELPDTLNQGIVCHLEIRIESSRTEDEIKFYVPGLIFPAACLVVAGALQLDNKVFTVGQVFQLAASEKALAMTFIGQVCVLTLTIVPHGLPAELETELPQFASSFSGLAGRSLEWVKSPQREAVSFSLHDRCFASPPLPLAGSAVQEASRLLNISEKTLLRRTRRSYGLTPKRAMRVLRAYAVVHQIATRQPLSFALASGQFGFADQAHLSREFRSILGWSPSGLRKAMTQLNAASLAALASSLQRVLLLTGREC